MWPSRFMENLPQNQNRASAPFEFDLQLWLGPVLVPSVAIERAWRTASSKEAEVEVQSTTPSPHQKRKIGLIATWRDRIHYRRELARLLMGCPHMIRDIGLTYEAAEAEIARPFWRASPKRGFGVTTIDGEVKPVKSHRRALAG